MLWMWTAMLRNVASGTHSTESRRYLAWLAGTAAPGAGPTKISYENGHKSPKLSSRSETAKRCSNDNLVGNHLDYLAHLEQAKMS